ncbi:L-threonine dehydratase catabolic TdcB-like [Sycon ciliatum]|uniref:L-threonine dehydratase catabolic TdcB-like n=1 Tax=Sycon ciliatum TaxID=27933 RepID=UPI0031F60443
MAATAGAAAKQQRQRSIEEEAADLVERQHGRCVTWLDIQSASHTVWANANVFHTPLLRDAGCRLGGNLGMKRLDLKLENTQYTGSFKIRGLANQMKNLPKDVLSGDRQVVTMSGGNYGRSFSFLLCKQNKLRATVVMPEFAPLDRVQLIEGYGATVERVPNSEIQSTVDRHITQDDMFFLHPFDDNHLIAGHGSCGLEILNDCPDVDVVIVCCGGGGILSGVAAAVKHATLVPGTAMFGRDIHVYGVEPEGAPKMHQSLQDGRPATCCNAKSIATGLSPPMAGDLTLEHVQTFVEEVVLVTDDEIVAAMKALYSCGQVVEPSGAASVAALLSGRIPDIQGKNVVAVVTGGNVSPADLAKFVG